LWYRTFIDRDGIQTLPSPDRLTPVPSFVGAGFPGLSDVESSRPASPAA
jgi:hypothetical protein